MSSFIDGFAGVLSEEAVAPGDEVVEVGHNGLEHEGGLAVTGYQEGTEGVMLPGIDGVDGFVLETGIGRGGEIDEDFFDHLHVTGTERFYFPEAFRRGAAAVVGRVKDVMKPLLRLAKAMILAEVNGNGHRDVVEELPVVDGISAAGRKIEIHDRIGVSNDAVGVVAGWSEKFAE